MMDDNPQDDLDVQLLDTMRSDFLEESVEHFEVLDHTLVLLEENTGNPELLEEVFRRIHTVKGTASFTGLNEINQIAHHLEDILSVIRSKKASFSKPIFDILFEGLSWLKKLRQAAISQKPTPDIASFVHRLKHAFENIQEKEVQRVSVEPTEASAPSEKTVETLRVRTGKLDAILNLVGELIVSKNKLNQFTRETEDRTLIDITTEIQRIGVGLHREVVEARLIPISSLFNLFYATIRNFAAQKSKKVKLSLKGGETLIDKRLKELLYDPFIHILRNSLDHGIEPPEEREKLGKKPEGKIEISADRVGDSIEIKISDDGRGLDPEKIVEKALKNGLVEKEKLDGFSEGDFYNLIFYHGFSTAEDITETSGRGVGMDVVKQNISELRGIILVDSKLGEGTRFTIQIPLSMFISKALILRVNETCIAIPFELIVEIIFPTKKQIDRIFSQKGRKTILTKNREIPLTSLPEIFENHSFTPIRFTDAKERDEDLALIEDSMGYARMLPRDDFSPVIILGLVNQLVALLVGELMDTEELIMKPISEFVGSAKGVAGSALLPNGEIALILDIGTLFEHV